MRNANERSPRGRSKKQGSEGQEAEGNVDDSPEQNYISNQLDERAEDEQQLHRIQHAQIEQSSVYQIQPPNPSMNELIIDFQLVESVTSLQLILSTNLNEIYLKDLSS